MRCHFDGRSRLDKTKGLLITSRNKRLASLLPCFLPLSLFLFLSATFSSLAACGAVLEFQIHQTTYLLPITDLSISDTTNNLTFSLFSATPYSTKDVQCHSTISGLSESSYARMVGDCLLFSSLLVISLFMCVCNILLCCVIWTQARA